MARPQLTADEVDATRKRLTVLALDLYLEEGLEALSFRRLAEIAGISHTLPYRYFDDKEGLLVAIRVECTERFERFVRAREILNAAPLEKIRQVAGAYVAYVQENPGEYQMMFSMHQPAPSSYPELLTARRRLFDHAVSVVQEAIDQGQLRGNALELAHLFWVSLHGLITLHVAQQLVHGLSLDELVAPLLERLLSGTHSAVVAPPPRRAALRSTSARAARK
jgi:AcrR family transcriptional regulator